MVPSQHHRLRRLRHRRLPLGSSTTDCLLAPHPPLRHWPRRRRALPSDSLRATKSVHGQTASGTLKSRAGLLLLSASARIARRLDEEKTKSMREPFERRAPFLELGLEYPFLRVNDPL